MPIPPLVDQNTWDRTQILKKQRLMRSTRNTKAFYLLQHLLRCSECGLHFCGRSVGKITEDQLDHQRKFITERLEILRNQLDDLRGRAANGAEKQATMEAVLAWAGEVGDGLDEMTPEQRKAVLQLVLENAIIDKHNQVRINLAIPAEVPVSIASASSAWT